MLFIASQNQDRRIAGHHAGISIAASTFLASFQEPASPAKTAKESKRPAAPRKSVKPQAIQAKSPMKPRNLDAAFRGSENISAKANSPGKNWARGQKVTKKSAKNYTASRTNSPTHSPTQSPKQQKYGRSTCPYSGPNPSKDRIPKNAPESNLYFTIRQACNKGNDDVATLRQLLPQRVCEGKDFGVWPRQHLLLHGLVKQGCVECAKYLISIGIDVNTPRQKDSCVPLHIAFYNLQGSALQAMVKMLLGEGADQQARNKWNEPPCMFKFKESFTATPKKSQTVQKPKPTLMMESPCGVADLDLVVETRGRSGSFGEFDLGPPATPTPKHSAARKTLTFGREVEQEEEHKVTVTEEATKLAEIVTLAASSYGVHKISSQIADWKVVSHKKCKFVGGKAPRAAFKTQQSGEMYNAVLRAVMV